MTAAAPGLIRLTHLMLALGIGCLTTVLLHLNSELGRHAGPLFASWAAHGTGVVAGLLMMGVLRSWTVPPPGTAVASAGPAPWWAYLGGCTGSVNVMVSTSAVNMGLALTGTQAIALSAQMLFSLAADRWGFFGLARRRIGWRELVPVMLIASGSLIIILFGTGEAP